MAHILVADDDPGLRDLLLRFLTDEGYRVETVVDGPQALAMIAASPPDLLITDLAMPDVTGWDVCTQAHRQVPHLPVIIISAVGPGVLQSAPAFPQHVVFLPKPFSLDLLLETMTQLLENSQAVETTVT